MNYEKNEIYRLKSRFNHIMGEWEQKNDLIRIVENFPIAEEVSIEQFTTNDYNMSVRWRYCDLELIPSTLVKDLNML